MNATEAFMFATACLMCILIGAVIGHSATQIAAIDAYSQQHCAPVCKDGTPQAKYAGGKFSCLCVVTRSVP